MKSSLRPLRKSLHPLREIIDQYTYQPINFILAAFAVHSLGTLSYATLRDRSFIAYFNEFIDKIRAPI